MRVSRLFGGLAAAAATLIVAAPVAAAPPVTGSGTGTVGLRSVTPVRVAGGNVFQDRDLVGTVGGTLVGTFEENVSGVIHASGLVTFHGTMTFTGTLAGCGSGTLTLGVSGQGVAGAPVTESSVRVIDGADNTIPAHGTGTVSQVGPNLTYEIQYQC
jgi:hypothetical protein